MNKFLNLAFKIGKVFSTFLLVLVLLIMLGSGIGLLMPDSAILKTPSFSTLKQQFAEKNAKNNKTNNLSNSTGYSQESNEVAPYVKRLEKIIRKNHLQEDTKYVVMTNIDRDINEEFINAYIKGLDKFYKDGLRYIDQSVDYRADLLWDAVYNIDGDRYLYTSALDNYKVNGTYSHYVGVGLSTKYHILFIDSLNDSVSQEQEKTFNKITHLVVFVISILIFSILLFLPVLIKIEENTRPTEEAKTDKNNEKEKTKTCVKCGKEIKLSAKKCRYCGTWQDEENGEDNE